MFVFNNFHYVGLLSPSGDSPCLVFRNLSSIHLMFHDYQFSRSLDDIAGKLTWLEEERSEVRIPTGQDTFLSPKSSRPALGPNQLPAQCVAGFNPAGERAVARS
jgi:hypothetical protein